MNMLQNNENIFLINSLLSANTNQPSFLNNPVWWTTMTLLVASLIWFYMITNYRSQQSELIEQLRIKISSDLHDEVGSILSGLAMQSEIMEFTASEDQKEKLHHLATMSRNALASMRDTVWALDARKDNWQSLMDRLYEHANETLSVKDIAFQMELSGMETQETLPLNFRQNLYLIAKEAITNTAKYSNGTQMTIQISKNEEGLNVKIHDNGQVDTANMNTSGLGLSNMKLRAERMGGSLAIDTQEGFAIVVVA